MTIVAGPKVVEDGLVLSYDFANKKSFSANVHPGSTNIYDWYVGIRGNSQANQSTISKDTIESPVGNTPLRMDVTGSDPHISSYNGLQWNLDEATSGDTWTVSVYAKASTNTTCQIFIFGANSSGQYIEAPAGARNITTEWQRISFTHTFANSNTVYIQSRLDGPDTQAGGNAVGQTIWFDGWQVERGSTATKFSPFYSDGNILDLSGKENVGNLVNAPAFSEDNYGTLVFDGTNDYIDCGTSNTLNFTTAFSVSFWMNNNISTNTLEYFVNRWTYSTGAYRQWSIDSGGVVNRINFRISSDGTDGGQTGIISTNASYSIGWHNICGTWNGSVMSLYVDGVLVAGPTTKTSMVSTPGQSTFIGGGNLGNTLPMSGNIALVSMYNRALTPIEIKQNFEATRGRFGI